MNYNTYVSDSAKFMKQNLLRMGETSVHNMLGMLLTLLTQSPRGIELSIYTSSNIFLVGLSQDRNALYIAPEDGGVLMFNDVQQAGSHIVQSGNIEVISIGHSFQPGLVELYRSSRVRRSKVKLINENGNRRKYQHIA